MKSLLTVDLCLSAVFVVVTSNPVQPTTEDLVRAFINDAMNCHRNRFNPAVTVAVVKDGNVEFADGFGHVDGKDSSSGRPTKDTLFGIASLTKAFTATLLVKQMQEANIPLYTYLRSSKLFDDNNLFDRYEHRIYATTKDILSHRMGFPNHNFMRLGKSEKDDIFQICKDLVKKAAIRTSFYYNNIMYAVATQLSEKLGGDTWENLMTSHLLQPIGMLNTTFARTAHLERLDLARHIIDTEGDLYHVPYNFTRRWADFAGSGSILSSASDMARYMNFLLANGKNTDGAQVVDPEVIEDIFSAQTARPDTSNNYFERPTTPITLARDVYTLGWNRGYYRGLPIYEHTGSTWGSSSILMLIPSKKLGIFVAMTGRDKDYLFRKTALTHIADLYLGETPWITASGSCDFPAPYHSGWSSNRLYIDRDEPSTRPLAEYTGTYTNTLYGPLNVSLEPDGLLHLHYGWSEFKLYPRTKDGDPDEFYMEGQGLLLNVMNFAECVFVHDGIHITKLRMTKWEPSQVPEFVKQYLI